MWPRLLRNLADERIYNEHLTMPVTEVNQSLDVKIIFEI